MIADENATTPRRVRRRRVCEAIARRTKLDETLCCSVFEREQHPAIRERIRVCPTAAECVRVTAIRLRR
jgi:hypothetical protein